MEILSIATIAFLVNLCLWQSSDGQQVVQCGNIGMNGGGFQGTSVNTEPLCRAACQGDSTCYSYDWDFNSNACWFHISCGSYSNNPYVQHYRKTTSPCPSHASCPIVKSYTTCYNVGMNGGVIQNVNSVNTVTKCQAACDGSPTCISFDWDHVNSACFIHTQCGSYVARQDTHHYRSTTSSCYTPQQCYPATTTVPVPTTFPQAGSTSYAYCQNFGMKGGHFQTGVNTIPLCEAACNGQSNCVSFDWDYYNNACFVHTNCGVYETRYDSHHYRRPSSYCAAPPNCPAVQQPQTHEVSGYSLCPNLGMDGSYVYQEGIVNTIEACAQACDGMAYCKSFDWEHVNNFCFIHTQCNSYAARGDRHHYRRSTSICTQPTQCQVSAYVFCRDVGMDGGTIQSVQTVNTVTKCEQACDGQPSCISFDWDHNNNACFLHTFCGAYRARYDTHHYRLPNTQCAAPSQCPASQVSPNQADYIVCPNSVVDGGTLISGSTAAICRSSCDQDSLCLAVNFDTNNARCYLVYNSGQQSSSVTIDNYIKLPQQLPPNQYCHTEPYTICKRTSVAGGEFRNAVTVAACQQLCDVTSGCFGFDFDYNYRGCFLLRSCGQIDQNRGGTNHYEKPNSVCAPISCTNS